MSSFSCAQLDTEIIWDILLTVLSAHLRFHPSAASASSQLTKPGDAWGDRVDVWEMSVPRVETDGVRERAI